MQYDEFIESVMQRTGLPREAAILLVHATLRVVAERLSGGEADDLRPRSARPPCWRRSVKRSPPASSMTCSHSWGGSTPPSWGRRASRPLSIGSARWGGMPGHFS